MPSQRPDPDPERPPGGPPERAPVRPRGARPLPEIPGYRIEAEIGRGATGVVYRARQLAVDREVALKVLHADLAAKPKIVRRLQREARTTARLAHPHIVSAIDMGETDGRWWYAMELVDGPSLALRIRQSGRLTERQALRLFIPLCEALQHAWEQGVVHRDIKPANILIDETGGARLADLGLAFQDDDPLLTSTGGTLGTPHYISPEQARDPATVDIRSDLWSFGATLYHGLCGRPPFSGESVAEVLSGVLYARVPDPRLFEPTLSPGLVLVLRKCLTRDIEQRYQTPRELLLDLERVRERRQPKVQRAELEPMAGTPGHLRAYLLGAALALVLIGSAWVVSMRPWQGPDEELERAPLAEAGSGPLEDLRMRLVERPDLPAAGAFQALDAIDPDALDPEQSAVWSATRNALRTRARGQLLEARDRISAEIDAALASGDYAAAERARTAGLAAAVRESSGFDPEALPPDLVDLGPWSSIREQDVLTQRDRARRTTDTTIAYVEERLLPRVDALEEEGRWRSAFEALEIEDEELLVAAGYASPGIPEAALERALAAPRERIAARRAALEERWSRVERNLASWIEDRARRIEGDLRRGELEGRAAARLEREWASELERRGLDPAELPPAERGPAGERDGAALPEQLAARGAELAALEDRASREAAEQRFHTIDGLVLPLWRAREYATAARVWARLEEQLRAFGGESDAVWRTELLERARLRRTEAEWLERWLERAGEAVRALDGQEVTLLLSSQKLRGRVTAGPDPLAAGFRLRGPQDPGFLVHLRRMRAEDLLERILRLPDHPGSLRLPEDRLTLALFQFHEGDLDGTWETLASGPLPGDWTALVEDLEARLKAAEELATSRAETHAERGRSLLALALEDGGADRAGVDRAGRAIVVDGLLRDYADLPEVAAAQGLLRDLQRTLRAPPPQPTEEDFRAAFDPQSVAFVGDDRVRLEFSFDGGFSGAWQPGSWVGWTGSASGASWGDLVARPGPRLDLDDPIDLFGGELELELVVEQPHDSGPPALLVVSVAGYHFALVGTGLPGTSAVGHVLAPGTVEELTARVRAGRVDSGGPYLDRGGRHRLRIQVDRAGRTASLAVRRERPGAVWRVVQDRTLLLEPDEGPESRSVVLRSWEPVRLISARLEAPRRR